MRKNTGFIAILVFMAILCFWACDSDNNSNASADDQNILGVVSDGDGQNVIPDASVTLTGVAEDGRTITRTTTTDASGQYSFNNIPPGDYSVSCEAWLNGKPFAAILQDLNLKGEGFDGTLNLFMREAGAVAGLVILPDNTRVPGAVVELIIDLSTTGTKQDESDPRLPLMTKTTDGSGFYEFEMVPLGNYALKVNKEGYPEVNIPGIAVQAGQTLALDITLDTDPNAKGTLTGFVYTVQMPGAEPATGDMPEFLAPLPGAEINVYEMQLDLAGNDTTLPPDDLGDPVYTALSDENGEYKIEEMEPGEYMAVCTADTYEPRSYHFRMPPGALLHHDFIMRTTPETGSISGTVTEDTGDLEIYVPIYNAHVFIEPDYMFIDGERRDDSADRPRYFMETWSNEQGEYEFAEVPEGLYFMWTSADGYHPDSMRAVEVQEDTVTTVNVKLEAFIQETGALEGTVTDYAGNTVPDVKVEAHHAYTMNGERIVAPISLIAKTTTNESGVYNFADLPIGMLHIIASKDGYKRADEIIEIIADDTVTQNFELLPEQTITVRGILKKLDTPEDCWAIYTENSDAEIFEPAGALAEEMKALPNADGLHVEVMGFILETFAPTCSGGVALEIIKYEILPGPGALQGKVTDETGNAIAEADVKLYPPFPIFTDGDTNADGSIGFPPFFYETKTDSEGNYEFGNLRPDMYVAEAWKEGYVKSVEEVEIPPDVTTTLNFTLEPPPPPGNLAGHVYNADGNALAGALVKLHYLDLPGNPDESGDVVIDGVAYNSEFKAETDADGAYLIENIPAAAFHAVAQKEGYVTSTEIVEINSGETATLDFILEPFPPVTIVGTLRYINVEGGCWQLRTPAGENYEPVGEKALELFAKEGADGAMVLINGYPSRQMASICMVGMIFVVEDYEILSTSDMVVEYRKHNLTVDDTTKPYTPHILRVYEGGHATLSLMEYNSGAVMHERLIAMGQLPNSMYDELTTYIDENEICDWEIEPPACDCVCPEFFISLPYCGTETRYDIMPDCLAPPEAFTGFQGIMDAIEASLPPLTDPGVE